MPLLPQYRLRSVTTIAASFMAAMVVMGGLWPMPVMGQGGAPANRNAKKASPDGEYLTPEVAEVTVDEHLGEFLDKDLVFVNHLGEQKKIGDYLDGKTPLLVTLNYYKCPGICNIQLGAVTQTLSKMDWTAGDGNFKVLTFSIDPTETPKLAEVKRSNILKELGRGEKVDWTFHTSNALNIQLLAAQLGVSYAFDREKDQYAHPPVIMFISPEGKIARYVYGLSYSPDDVKFALMEASQGRVGSTVDRLILSCFHYDASSGKYAPFAFGMMRVAAVAMILVVGFFLVFAWRRERRRRSMILEAQR